MKPLVPLSDYELTTGASFARTAIVMAALWGAPMTAYLWYARGSLPVATVLSIGIFSALLFGVGWTLWMRHGTTKLMRRLYAADPVLFPKLPDGFDTGSPASLMNGSAAVGGLLLLAPGEARFVPHVRNLKRHQNATHLRLDSSSEIHVVERRPNAVGQLFRPGPVRLVELRTGEDSLTLLVPVPDRVASVIRERVGFSSPHRTA